MASGHARDQLDVNVSMACAVFDLKWRNLRARELGGITADLTWLLYAGKCEYHGWFQAEVVSHPLGEVYPVDRPFGVDSRMLINGEEAFAFPTTWNDRPSWHARYASILSTGSSGRPRRRDVWRFKAYPLGTMTVRMLRP
jgi:hypothetical protein